MPARRLNHTVVIAIGAVLLYFFEQWLSPATHNARTHYELGTAKYRAGHMDDATADFERVLILDPDAYATHLKLGRLLGEGGDLAGEEFHYREAIRLRPRFAEARYNLARLLLARGAHDEALAQLESALRDRPTLQGIIAPALVAAHLELARARFDAGDVDAAGAAFQKAINAARAAKLAELAEQVEQERKRRGL